MVQIISKKAGKRSLSLLIVVFLFVLTSLTMPQHSEDIEKILFFLNDNAQSNEEVFSSKEVLQLSSPSFEIVFCPYESGCRDLMMSTLKKAESSIKCSFYELDYSPIVDQLNEKENKGVEVEIIVDDEYLNEPALTNLDSSVDLHSDLDRNTRYNNYMHHKFCVIDEKITLVSSANPTQRGLMENNNNMEVFYSKNISRVFLQEFEQLKEGTFGYNKEPITLPSSFNFTNSTLNSLDVYMCPQDQCGKAVTGVLENSTKSIYFASFVITLDSIEEILINKSQENVVVEGVVEERSWNSQGSRTQEMQNYFSLKKDKNPATMHHKFFVVDERYVITGSMNPSNSGANYNDENLLIIESPEIAELFIEEFRRVQ